jgi:hypothetical protein
MFLESLFNISPLKYPYLIFYCGLLITVSIMIVFLIFHSIFIFSFIVIIIQNNLLQYALSVIFMATIYQISTSI